MAFDGIVTGAVGKELKTLLTGLRVDKVYQVENDEILLHFRKHKLLISSSGNNPRIYLTDEKKESPKEAPIFSMVLRKHLNGAILKDVVQYGNDRVLEIIFDAWDDFSEKIEKSLLIEIMGRHSNIILIDENKNIIDAIKRVNTSMSRVREVLPHLPYEYIKDEGKLDPILASETEIREKILSADGNKTLANLIFSSFTGFSKSIGNEVSLRSNIDSTRPMSSLETDELEKIISSLIDIIEEIKSNSFKNAAYFEGEKIIDFHVLDLKSMLGFQEKVFDSPSKLLDSVYSTRDRSDRMVQKSQAIRKFISNRVSKDVSKLANLEKDLLEAQNREIYRIYADILSSNFHRISPGQKEVTLENFYTDNMEEILIPLDEKISGPQNAQKYYKKYRKLKNAEAILNEQIFETKSEIDYLESVLSQIELSEEIGDLEVIKDELIEQGYVKRNQKKKSKKKNNDLDLKIYEVDDFKIIIGKNNRENDLITHKYGKKDDLWFHVQGIPGSHVLIKTEGKEVPDKIIKFAAELAAYNSKARNSGSVEVDYTKKQFVKRHPANKPGLVNYTDFQTLLVSSNEKK